MMYLKRKLKRDFFKDYSSKYEALNKDTRYNLGREEEGGGRVIFTRFLTFCTLYQIFCPPPILAPPLKSSVSGPV